VNRITSPLGPADHGPAVAALQDALIFLRVAGRLDADGAGPDGRDAALGGLMRERASATYGDATAESVVRLRRVLGVPTGPLSAQARAVDAPLAERIDAELEANGAFDDTGAVVASDVTLAGRVEFEDGSPGRGFEVAVFDRDLGRRRDPLGERRITNDDGAFDAVRFRTDDARDGEGRGGRGPDVVFEVRPAGEAQPLEIVGVWRRSSGLVAARRAALVAGPEFEVRDPALGFAPAAMERVRIVVRRSAREQPDDRGEPEYRRLLADLVPMLLDGGTPADMDQERFRDLDFAARETGWPRATVETMSSAWGLAVKAASRRELDVPGLAESLYGLLRDGPPASVPALPATLDEIVARRAEWKPRIEDSVAARLVGGAAAEHLARLRALLASDPADAGIAAALANAGLDERQRDALMRAWDAHDGTVDEFWRDAVRGRLGWSEQNVAEAQGALQLSEMVGHDARLLARLHGAGIRQARELTRIDRLDWLALVAEAAPDDGSRDEARLARAADAIVGLVEATFPNEVLARVAATSRDTQLAAARDHLVRFLERETAREGGFDVRTTPVTSYLEANAARVFEGMDTAERTRFTSQLKRLQRAYRMGMDREQSEALLELGLDSALEITRFSPDHFAAEFGVRLGGAERARVVYGRAEHIAGTMLHLFTAMWDGMHAPKPSVLMSASAPETIPALKEVAAYRDLFGALNLCACSDCQSIYSPAAYFVDLLHMLDRPSLGAANPVEALFARRPDLAHIQLTCGNTNTRVPYIDLVAEVLEAFVATGTPTAFNVPPTPPAPALPTPSAEELRVNPVYLTPASAGFADTAYDALQEAVFPLSLPFDLPLETTRTYLGHLGVSRADLMRLLDRDEGLVAMMAQAGEALGLGPDEFEALTGSRLGGESAPRPATDAELFGLTEGGDPKTAFDIVTPEFAPPPAPADGRRALLRSLQNMLARVGQPATVTGEYDAATVAAVNAYRVAKGLGGTGTTDAAFWGALEADGIPPISAMMCPVPMFLDRSGLAYEELVALVKSRYVNPTLQGDGTVDFLTRLGIAAADVRAWIAAGFPALAPAQLANLTAAGVTVPDFTRWVQARARAIVLDAPIDAPCDVAGTTLVHLDGTVLSGAELLALLAFVRMQRRLGWTLEEMDLAVDPGALRGAAAFNAVLRLGNLAQLRARLDAPMAELVALHAPVPTHGERPLYDRLFRNRAAQTIDPALALNGERTEIAAPAAGPFPDLSNHLPAIMAGMGVGAADLEAIRAAAHLADDLTVMPAVRAPLTLSALSTIYRHVALARMTRLSVADLLALLELTGLDAFERPDRLPRGAALDFLDVVTRVRDSGVKVAELLYLCRDVPQPPAIPGARRDVWRRALAALIDGRLALDAEQPIADDPGGELLAARLTELLGPDDARSVAELLLGLDVRTASVPGLPAAFAVPASLGARVEVDAARGVLRVRGALTTGDVAALLAAPGVPGAAKPAWDRAVKSIDGAPRALVRRALLALYAPADPAATLIEQRSLDASGAPDRAAIDAKVAEVLAHRRRVLGRSLVRQVLATETGLPAEVVALLLEDETVLTASGGAGAALADYQDVDGTGLAAEYFANVTLAGAPAATRTDGPIAFAWAGGAPPAPGVPASGFSVRWRGWLYVPAGGEVTLRVRGSDGVRVRVADAFVIDEWSDQPETEFQAALRLEGSRFHAIEVEHYDRSGSPFALWWGSPSIPSAVVPASALYTGARLDALLLRVERLDKIARLLVPFGLGRRDVRVLAANGTLALDQLPLGGPAALPVARAMFSQWEALGSYAALRNRYPGTDVGLSDVLSAATRADAVARFETISGAPAASIESGIDALTAPRFDVVTSTWHDDAPDLAAVGWWTRIAEVIELARRTGATPAQLAAWARAREVRTTPTGPETHWYAWTAVDADGIDRRGDSRALAQASKDIARARYDEPTWRAAARPLNDALRARRTAALTAYLLASPQMMQARVTDTGRLFEYLLIDPEMDPCMETSRIKQGCASVQTFMQRVLLDLESPLVPPVRVDRARFEIVKTFRVWEADRRILFDTEAYLVPALRDGKTPTFEEFESNLLQDERTDANVERAFRRYLESVDRVAKLVVCGTCVDDQGQTLHVFGRTATAPSTFHHRRLVRGRGAAWADGTWTPWRKLPVDVAAVEDGAHSGIALLPIVWNRRLYLFWPVFEKAPQTDDNLQLPEGFDPIDCWNIRLAWSEYKDDRWTPKQLGHPFVTSKAFFAIRHPEYLSDPGSAYGKTLNFHHAFEAKVEWISQQPITLPLSDVIWTPPPVPVLQPKLITWDDDEMLAGVNLPNQGDWAVHDRATEVVDVLSLLPRPAAHWLDASTDNGALTITVMCRFKGITKGQQRKTTTDVITVVSQGRRTDRRETSVDDSRITDVEETIYRQAGVFSFPACGAGLAASDAGVDLKYESLDRPPGTINAYMALRDDWPRAGGLRLSATQPIMLTGAREPFDVIDADDRTGMDRRGPFFFQDQRRGYLVTKESRFDGLVGAQVDHVSPDALLRPIENALGLQAMALGHERLAADAPARSNAWAASGLARWAAGPAVPATLRAPAIAGIEPAHPSSPTGLALASAPSALEAASGLVVPAAEAHHWGGAYAVAHGEYRFTTHWHPQVCPLLAALARGGLPELLDPQTQGLTDVMPLIGPGGAVLGMTATTFETVYKPDPSVVAQPYPVECVEFGRPGAYAQYNWETFFHAPLRVACLLADDGKHAEAMRWFHFIFDPMSADTSSGAARVWRFLPFRTADTTSLEEQIGLLTYTGSDATKLQRRAALEASIQEWLANPFRPHAVARMRPAAYMKHVFMKYLDNLIAWADTLFARDTIESIVEALQLYVLCANHLGARATRVPAPGSVAPESYQTLRAKLDLLSNAQVDLETRLPFTQMTGAASGGLGTLGALPRTPYFCLPPSEKLLAYWDTIADRLFKIRHCMTLDGTVRDLPLFEPRIDPMLLVEAVANGLDIGSVLDDLYAPLPRRRFTAVLQEALAACDELRTLGGSLQAAMEKQDAEGLQRLRAEHESRLLDQVRSTRQLQIDESEESRQALEASVRMVQSRIQHYETELAQGLIAEETDQLANIDLSNARQEVASGIEATAQALNLIPNVLNGPSGGPQFGGSNLGGAVSAVARSYSYLSSSYAYRANRSSITGQQARRADDWGFQRDLAKQELAQVERQLAAARIRGAVARAELRSHETQLEHARRVEEVLRGKDTSEAFYESTRGALQRLHGECLRFTRELVQKTRRALEHEVGAQALAALAAPSDGAPLNGLLSGERLHRRLRQMERLYHERPAREFELTKHVSIAQLDPLALVALKATGSCEIEIPEWFFDLDYPGHYYRRLKSVTLTIPAVVGPYTSLAATLTLLESRVRESPRVVGSYDDEENFRADHLPIEAIAASSAQNDGGRFELDLHGDLLLPFEGAGAISRWRIALPADLRAFPTELLTYDYDTITDVVLTFRMTTRRDGTLAGPARKALRDRLTAAAGGSLFRLFSLRHEFPNEWQRLRAAPATGVTLPMSTALFPLLAQGRTVTIDELHHVLILRAPRPAVTYGATLTPPAGGVLPLAWPGGVGRYRGGAGAVSITVPPPGAAGGWHLTLTAPTPADLEQVQDVLLVGRYTISI
jgi:peptidoglycan hydrolase-like protein with peptidoglycan-binding domain